MIQLRTWKVVLVVLAAVFGVVFTLPNALPKSVTDHLPAAFAQRLNLGLDLQGGSYLQLQVDSVSLKSEQLNNLTEDVRRTLGDGKIGFTGLAVSGDVVKLRVNDAAQVTPVVNLLRSKLAQATTAQGGHELNIDAGADQTVTLSYPEATWRELTASAVQQSIEVVRRRIDQLGTREPTILRQGTDRIVIEAPGEATPKSSRTSSARPPS